MINDLNNLIDVFNVNMGAIAKLFKNQKKINKRVAWFTVISSIYLVDTRNKCLKQKEEIRKLTKELEELKATKGE